MSRRSAERFRGVAIERLHIDGHLDQPFLMQIGDTAGDATQRKTGGNPVAGHALPEKAGRRCQRRAGTGLHGKAFFEIPGMLDDVRGPAGNEQIARVPGDACRAHADQRGIAHLIELDDQIDPVLRNADREIWKTHHLLGQQYHSVSVLRIDLRVAE